MTTHFIHVMQQLVSYFSDLHFRSDRLLLRDSGAKNGTYSKKSTRRIQVGITPLIIFILDPLHVDFMVKRRSLIHRRSKPS